MDNSIEDFIAQQKQKLAKERETINKENNEPSPRRQWDKSGNRDVIGDNKEGLPLDNNKKKKQEMAEERKREYNEMLKAKGVEPRPNNGYVNGFPMKENVPPRLDSPEVPLVAKLGDYEKKHFQYNESRKKEYNQIVYKDMKGPPVPQKSSNIPSQNYQDPSQNRAKARRAPDPTEDSGAVLPGLRESYSAKQRKMQARNEEYNQFLKQKQERERHKFDSKKPPQPERERQRSRPDFSGPPQNHYTRRPDPQPPRKSERDVEKERAQDPGGEEFFASLPIGERNSANRRKEQIRNQEYNDFLKHQPVAPGVKKNRRERGASLGVSFADTPSKRNPDDPPDDQHPQARTGWGTPTYDDILDQKRREERAYRRNDDVNGSEYRLRPAVSDGYLDKHEEVGFNALDRQYEQRKARFQESLYGSKKPGVSGGILDNDKWLDTVKDPRSNLEEDFQSWEKPRTRTAMDYEPSFVDKRSRVQSAPQKDGLPLGNPSRDEIKRKTEEYRRALEQQIAIAEENKKREKQQELRVNATGEIDITKSPRRTEPPSQYEPSTRAPTRQPMPPSNLDMGPSSLLSNDPLGIYSSPLDEAYRYYATHNPLDAGDPRDTRGDTRRVNFAPSSNRSPPQSSVQYVPKTNLSPEENMDEKKRRQREYQLELERQMRENDDKKRRAREEKERYDRKLEEEIKNYDPFGKGGGGAPLKDKSGQVLADLRQLRSNNESGTGAQSYTPRVEATQRELHLDLNKSGSYTPRDQPQTSYRDPSEPNHARGGHGIFGQAKTDSEKIASDKYKDDLRLQIEEKKRKQEEEKMKEKLEEERQLKILEDQRKKMQEEFDAELKKQKDKEEAARLKNEEMKRLAEEKKKEMDQKRREVDDKRDQEARAHLEEERIQRERERERQARGKSPPIPTLRKPGDETARGRPSPRVEPTPRRDPSPRVQVVDRPGDSLGRAPSADVLNHLNSLRRQLQSERQRVESDLEKQKYDVEVFDPRLVQPAQTYQHQHPEQPAPTTATTTSGMVPVAVLSPNPPNAHRTPDPEIFDTALKREPVHVKRPVLTDDPNANALHEFYKHRHRESNSRQALRSMFPQEPSTGTDLEAQQLALLRQQEEQLERLKRKAGDLENSLRPGVERNRSMLHSDSAFIDDYYDGDRRRRRNENGGTYQYPDTDDKKKTRFNSDTPSSSIAGTSMGSTLSLDPDHVAKKNESRMKKLSKMGNDTTSQASADEILDRFMSKQRHDRPPSRNTLNDDEAWLRSGSR